MERELVTSAQKSRFALRKAKERARNKAIGRTERPAIMSTESLAAITTAKDRLAIPQADAIGALAAAAYALIESQPEGAAARDLVEQLATILSLPAAEVSRRLYHQPALPFAS